MDLWLVAACAAAAAAALWLLVAFARSVGRCRAPPLPTPCSPPHSIISPAALRTNSLHATQRPPPPPRRRRRRADADLSLLRRRRPPPGAYRGQVVWVVGASQGLGEALALRWARLGARLVLSARSPEGLAAVRRACRAAAPAAAVLLLPLDVTGGAEALQAGADAAFAAFGGAGVDVLVHVAGASQHAAAEETSAEVAAALLAVNLTGPLGLARAALPAMLRAGRGRQVVVTSMSSVVPSPGQAVYAAAKAGLRAYFASVACEMAGRCAGVKGRFADGSEEARRALEASCEPPRPNRRRRRPTLFSPALRAGA
jgi:dehydrogenase/reductase SDR family protein 7